MPTLHLTQRALASISSPDRPTIYFDTVLRGFGLRVWPSGARKWIVEYRAGGGGRSASKIRMTIGSTEQFEPDAARRHAREILADVVKGKNPMAERRANRAAETIAELEKLYSVDVAPRRKPKSVELHDGHWRNHLLPEIGTRKAIDISEADVARLHRRITEGKTGPTRQGKITPRKPTTANRALALLYNFYVWAQRNKYVPRGFNPVVDLPKNRETSRERYLSSEELARLAAAIREAETAGIAWPPPDLSKPGAKHAKKKPENRLSRICAHTAAAMRLLIFTGARLREILHLRWDEIDLERGLLRLADSKTGKKTIVLSAAALSIIAGLDKVGEYVIPGDDIEHPRADLKRPWALVTKRAGLDGLRIHDLRHTFASIGAGAQLGLPLIGGLLGHSDSRTTQRYAHLAADPLRAASNAIGDRLTAAMNGETP